MCIPFGEKITTLSPKKAIIHSNSLIPPCATSLVLILYEATLCDYSLPSSLKSLTLQTFVGYFNDIPPTLTKLAKPVFYHSPAAPKPRALTHLTLGDNACQPPISVYQLLPTLTHFTTGNRFNESFYHFPSNLTHLVIERDFNKPFGILS
jgi:hypothetical protein